VIGWDRRVDSLVRTRPTNQPRPISRVPTSDSHHYDQFFWLAAASYFPTLTRVDQLWLSCRVGQRRASFSVLFLAPLLLVYMRLPVYSCSVRIRPQIYLQLARTEKIAPLSNQIPSRLEYRLSAKLEGIEVLAIRYLFVLVCLFSSCASTCTRDACPQKGTRGTRGRKGKEGTDSIYRILRAFPFLHRPVVG
jgi:hypothetical protein